MSSWKIILCPIDFSEPSYTALKAAHDLAVALGSELLVLHVTPEMEPVLGIISEEEFDQSRKVETIRRIHQEVRRHLGEGAKVRPLVGSGVAETEIVRIADAEQANMVVIATHGMTGWRRLVYGSVTEAVGRLAHCPVLIVHEQSESRAATKA